MELKTKFKLNDILAWRVKDKLFIGEVTQVNIKVVIDGESEITYSIRGNNISYLLNEGVCFLAIVEGLPASGVKS